jgi:hypothetical protein
MIRPVAVLSTKIVSAFSAHLCCCRQLARTGVGVEKVPFARKQPNSGDTKCLGIREDRLQRILTQFHFREFSKKEFFNSHRR